MNALIFILFLAAVLLLMILALNLGVRKKDKKRAAAALGCCGAVICVGVVWFFMPFQMLPAKPEQVESVEIFSGNTGQAYTVSDESEIRKIAENLDTVKLVRKKVEWRSGYSLRVTVNYDSGRSVGYIINSEKDVVADGFVICECKGGRVDYDYLCSLVG